MRGRRIFCVQLLCVAVLPLASGPARASGFALLEQNGSGLGRAYAGTAAAADDASSQRTHIDILALQGTLVL
jgi:long-subunit fatty acid transport protein